eukprot:615338-Alexandrium_andersonii.AAC.1
MPEARVPPRPCFPRACVPSMLDARAPPRPFPEGSCSLDAGGSCSSDAGRAGSGGFGICSHRLRIGR